MPSRYDPNTGSMVSLVETPDDQANEQPALEHQGLAHLPQFHSVQSQYLGVNAYQPNAVLGQYETMRFIDNSPVPAPPPRSRTMPRDVDNYFLVRDELGQQFINRVYNDYTPMIGDYVAHRNFVVTEEYCTRDDLAFITHLRRRAGIDAEGRNIRQKLPREPVEALPLPG